MNTQIDNKLKLKLLLYLVISSVSFTYLILPQKAGISVIIFAVMQFLLLFYIVPDRRKLFVFIPMGIMALNCFISANNIWRIPNAVLCVILLSSMLSDIDIKKDSTYYFEDIYNNIFSAFSYFSLPFEWVSEHSRGKGKIIKKIIFALVISLPCVFLLIVILSSADMVFSSKIVSICDKIFKNFQFNPLMKIIFGFVAGLYLFGMAFGICTGEKLPHNERKTTKKELLTINIVFSSILVVYTMFVMVQFKYLFAGAKLPDGLTFTTYARKGFFELMALSGVNLVLILMGVYFTKNTDSGWSRYTKILCHYLCAVTIVLLVSSYYRMLLYTWSDGLTRLRFFVMGFLIFEAVGLLITFFYIARPKFNITLIYILLAMIYYMALNVIPVDNIIAVNQTEKYLRRERNDIDYVLTLSADVAPTLHDFYFKCNDEKIKEDIEIFLKKATSTHIPDRWQRYNLSCERGKRIIREMKLLN